MALRQTAPKFSYGLGDDLIQLPPEPIIANRNPNTNDFAQRGAIWINESNNQSFVLSSITNNSAEWLSTDTNSNTTINGNLTLNGDVIAVADTATGPAATAAVTIDSHVGIATLTGFTQASGADLTVTINNSFGTANSAYLVTSMNLGSNNARMTVDRVVPATGSFDIILNNKGAAALNGDVIITFWLIRA